MTRFVPTREDPPIQVLAAPARDRLPQRIRLWRTLACCVLAHRVGRDALMPVWPQLFDRYPTQESVMAHVFRTDRLDVIDDLEILLRPLGFQRRRATLLVDLAAVLVMSAGSVLRGDLPVESLPGCGAYAREAVDLFVHGNFERRPTSDHVLTAWWEILMDGADVLRHSPGGRQARPRPGQPQSQGDSAMSATTTAPAAPKTGDMTQRIKDALTDHGPANAGEAWDKNLTPEQVARAWEAKTSKRGLRGKALAAFILTGDGVVEQAAKAPKPAKAPRAPSKPRASRYPDDIRAAVQRVYELMGKSHGPGPKQHVEVRKAIGDQDPVAMTGFPSLKKLTEFAKGEGGKLNEQTDKVRVSMKTLYEGAGADPFARGKHLACIVVAYAEQKNAAKKGK